ncbi:hypothetical protein [Okeania sp. KiyG1]|nr:hypothetical protein [Okeania sp. KiyG1]
MQKLLTTSQSKSKAKIRALLGKKIRFVKLTSYWENYNEWELM